jgi:hypothetical protein
VYVGIRGRLFCGDERRQTKENCKAGDAAGNQIVLICYLFGLSKYV